MATNKNRGRGRGRRNQQQQPPAPSPAGLLALLIAGALQPDPEERRE